MSQSEPPEVSMELGQEVRLLNSLPYLKSADPMPMLRPADLISEAEVGQVVGIRAGTLVAVRFLRGTFLLNSFDLETVSSQS